MSSTESASAGVIGRIVVIAASTPENAAMKVYLSVDMEGVAGIVDWQQCLPGGDDYALGRDLLLGEVNAAIDGALAAGAAEILVNDSHSVMRNLPPAGLHGRTRYLSGRFKPRYMTDVARLFPDAFCATV